MVVQWVVVKELCYKPKGRGFDTWRGEWFLSIYLILLAALGPGVYSASNRKEYQKQTRNSWEDNIKNVCYINGLGECWLRSFDSE
jgi:hypothetical protein